MKTTTPNIERYAALSAAFLGTAVATNASVVYTDIDPDAAAITGTDVIDIDMNNDGIVDFQFRGTGTSFSSSYFAFRTNIAQMYGVNGGAYGFAATSSYGAAGYAVAALNSGDNIGPSGLFNSSTWATVGGFFSFSSFGVGYGSAIGPMPGAGEKFIGVSFDIGGNQHYGWIRIDVAADAGSYTIFDYAYEDQPGVAILAGDGAGAACSAANAPTNPTHVDGVNSATLSWDPISQSVACQVQGTRLIPAGPSPSVNIIGSEPSSTNVPYAAAGAGTTWEWKVRCACSITPIDATPFSVTDTFSVPTLRVEQEMEAALFPNPASDQVMLGTGIAAERDTEIRIMDLTGRVVDFVILPEDARNIQLDVSALENGMYFVQVGEMEAIALEVTH